MPIQDMDEDNNLWFFTAQAKNNVHELKQRQSVQVSVDQQFTPTAITVNQVVYKR
jgi:general stress protein 26